MYTRAFGKHLPQTELLCHSSARYLPSGFISRFPLLTSLVAACTFLFLSFVVLAACLLPALELRFDSDPHFNDPPPPRPKRSRRHTSIATSSDAPQSPRSPRLHGRNRSGTDPIQSPVFKEEDIELDPFDPTIDPEQLPPDLRAQYELARQAAQLAEPGNQLGSSSASDQHLPTSGTGEQRDYPRRRRSRQTLQESDED